MTLDLDVACACGKQYPVKSDLLGRSFRCKRCGSVVAVEVIELVPIEDVEPEPEPNLVTRVLSRVRELVASR
jgi:hypothetical protein